MRHLLAVRSLRIPRLAVLSLFELPKSAWMTIGCLAILNATTVMVVPFLAVYMTQYLHESPTVVGTVLTAYLIAVRLLPALTGSLGDHLGARWLVALGCLVRGCGLLAFPHFVAQDGLVAAAFVVGLGGALAEPALSAMLASEAETSRTSIFAIRNQMSNASFILGAAFGGALAGIEITVPYYVSGCIFLVLAVLAALYAPTVRQKVTGSLVRHYRTALSHRQFLAFWVAMLPWWVLYTQIFVALPLQAFRITQQNSLVGLMFTVSGVVGIFFVVPVAGMYRRLSPTRALLIGMAVVAISFLAVPLANEYAWFLACIVVYTLGESLVLVGIDLVVASYTNRATMATFFGLFATCWAVGGTVGNYLGSWLNGYGDGWLSWAVFGAIGILGMVAIGIHSLVPASTTASRPVEPLAGLALATNSEVSS
jgi:MFS family permease